MENSKTYYFRVADFNIRIVFKSNGEKKDGAYENGLHLIPSLIPFQIDRIDNDDPLFELVVDDDLRPRPKQEREPIKTFDTGNGDTIVDLLNDGGYQYIVKDIQKKDCCLLITNKNFDHCQCALNGNFNMRRFGINNALMLAFAFSSSRFQTVLMHASLVRQNGYGYAFIAKSGTGKSTQVSMWLRYLPGCDLMNDDSPIVRIIDNQAYIYGSPWSGKTPCYRNTKAKLGAITQIDRAKANSVEPLAPIQAFTTLLPACSSMKWDVDIYHHSCDTITKLLETTGIYTLHCLPNREAAEVCNKAIRVE
ncbi:hypothetical protein [Hallella colorans]|uniref:HprK-related kinase B n=1 Tax=Hallella colorans TaxID=1703337 RepID=A0A2U0UBS5_9BACT|nr:hypothetical protein [Hallella colorans]PVX55094.1 hypothetical protein C7379_10773 [Hallella colorans]